MSNRGRGADSRDERAMSEAYKRIARNAVAMDNARPGSVGALDGLLGQVPETEQQNYLRTGLRGMSMLPIPGWSDAAGLLADAQMYASDPSARTWPNYALTGAAAVLPFLPGLATLRGAGGGGDDLADAIGDTIKTTRSTERLAPKALRGEKRFKGGAKAGIYKGTEAFGSITPAKLGAMRKNYLADAKVGAPYSKYWYDDTSKDLFRLAGQDVHTADNLAHTMAALSSRTPVGANTMYGFKGWNQNLMGDPVKTGAFPNVMGAKVEDILNNQGSAGGLKRDPYAGGLSIHWRPDPNLRPTNDIHQVRAWGITDPKTGKPWSKGVGAAGHRFLDEQTNWVVDRLNQEALQKGLPADWNSYRTQAAAWSPQRVKAGIVPSLEEAAKHYGDFINDYSANLTREWIPGDNTNHLREALSANDEFRQAFSDAMEGTVRGPEGIDALAHGVGALSDTTLPNLGIYEGVTSPGYVSRIPVGKAPGMNQIDPSSRKMMNALASAHGLTGVQKQSAWNFVSGPDTAANAGTFQFVPRSLAPGEVGVRRPPGPLDPAEMRRLNALIEGSGLDVPQAAGEGARAFMWEPGAREAGEAARTRQAAPFGQS